MSIWTIQGESGKALGASSVDLELTPYQGVQYTHTNQGTDTLSFFVRCDDPTVDPQYLPEYNQTISLWKSGVRQFVGYVGKPKFLLQGGMFGWQVEAQNGWQELDRVALSDSDKEYARAQGPLTATVQDVINKAIAGGARISLGSVATMFDIPPISFRGTFCGAALAELLKICADAVAYFDYTVGGHPALTIVRRGSMTAKTITFGSDDIIEPFSCSPIPGVTPSKVTVAFAIRDANGVVTETVQSAGSGSDTQAVILTEPNFADWQTKAIAAQVSLRTGAATPTWADFKDLSQDIQQVTTDHGSFTLSPANSTNTRVWTGSVSSKLLDASPFVAPFFSCPTSLTGWYPLVIGDHREWMQKNLGIAAKVGALEGDWVMWRTYSGAFPPYPAWWVALVARGAVLIKEGFWANAANGDSTKQSMAFFSPKLEVTFIDVSIASATNYRDSGPYGTLAPPATLAAELLAAQNFTPYEGRFNLSPWHTPERLISQKISFGGLTSRLSSIGALVQSETTYVATGAKSLAMGLPTRQGNTALGRLRKLGS